MRLRLKITIVLLGLMCIANLSNAQLKSGQQYNAMAFQDSLGLGNMFKIDFVNFFDVNPALLLSFEHRLAKNLRLSHEAGPIFQIEAYNTDSELEQMGLGLYGLKLREDIKLILREKRKNQVSYIAFSLFFSHYRSKAINFVESVNTGGDTFFRSHQGFYNRQKLAYHLKLGLINTDIRSVVIDWSAGVGFQFIDQGVDAPTYPEAIDDIDAWGIEGNMFSINLSVKIGFNSTYQAKKLGLTRPEYDKLSKEERRKLKGKHKEQKRINKSKPQAL